MASTSLTAIGTPSSAEAAAPGRPALVGGPGRGQRALGVDVQEGVHGAVDGGDPVEVRLGHLDRGGLAGGERVGELGGGAAGQVAHASSPRIRGTLKRCCSTSGAPGRAPARR